MRRWSREEDSGVSKLLHSHCVHQPDQIRSDQIRSDQIRSDDTEDGFYELVDSVCNATVQMLHYSS